MTAQLLSSKVFCGGPGVVQVNFKWRTPSGFEWDGARCFPTLGHALDHLGWLYAEQRQEFGLQGKLAEELTPQMLWQRARWAL
jgi:hypothetical protein